MKTSWQLANLAGCYEPDNHDGLGFDPPSTPEALEDLTGSAGAQFLRGVESDTLEAIEEGRWDEDAHEIADNAVPIYTHNLWQTFTDLGAYNEDPTDLGEDGSDMTRAASACLYIIAERLAQAIASEIEGYKQRLEELREVLQAETISYGEMAELQDLAEYIAADDLELREAAGLPEQV